MKFSEVIATLEKDPKKKFIMPLSEGSGCTFNAYVSDTGYFRFTYSSYGKEKTDVIFDHNISLSDEWQELQPTIEVGDKVKVVDPGESYSTYANWFKENNIDANITARYQYGTRLTHKRNIEGHRYKVVAKGKHVRLNDMLYAIEDQANKRVYLIGEAGIEKVEE